MPSTRWSRLPTPPDAMTGTGTLSAMACVSGRSKPCRVPSRSIEVSRISPAPSETTSWAYSMASIPVELRPPWVKISQRSPPPPRLTRLASIATTMHCSPNFSAACLTNSRLLTAAELIETLSAPYRSSVLMSSMVRTPPPTVSGMKQASAVRRTTSSMVPRFSWVAVMSRKHNSSAPAASYAIAASTGSPASRRSTKLTPLTTRPSLTSRQGITRTLNITPPLRLQSIRIAKHKHRVDHESEKNWGRSEAKQYPPRDLVSNYSCQNERQGSNEPDHP